MAEQAAATAITATPPTTTPQAAPSPAQPAAPAAAVVAGAEVKADAAQSAVDNAAPKPGETPQDFELRLSKLQREARIARESEGRLKAQMAEKDKELASLREEMSKAKKKRLTRSEYLEMSKAMAKDPDKVREYLDDDTAQIPPELRERLEKLEQTLRAKEEEESRRNTDAVVQREVGIISTELDRWQDDFPLLHGNKVAPEHIRQLWHSQWEEMGKTQESKPNLREVVSELHDSIAKTVASALQSTKARQYLAKLVPDLGTLLAQQEASAGSPGSDAQGAAGSNGRTGVSNPASRPDPKSLTDEQKRELRLAALQEAQKARKAGAA